MAAAERTGALVDWRAELAALKQFVALALGRAETRETAGVFIDGLLSAAERKTGWMLAEAAGLKRPYRIQSSHGLFCVKRFFVIAVGPFDDLGRRSRRGLMRTGAARRRDRR